jgi:hypothetical protein
MIIAVNDKTAHLRIPAAMAGFIHVQHQDQPLVSSWMSAEKNVKSKIRMLLFFQCRRHPAGDHVRLDRGRPEGYLHRGWTEFLKEKGQEELLGRRHRLRWKKRNC